MPEVIKVDTKTASEEFLTRMWETYVLLGLESHPDQPSTPVDQAIASWRAEGSEFQKLIRWVVLDDNQVVAAAVIFLDMAQNLDNGFARISVHPEHRGNGHCRLLAPTVFDTLEEEKRSRVDTWVVADTEHSGLPARLGLKSVYTSRESELKISDLDLDLMDSWIKRAADRAGDYELRFVDSPIPDSILDDFCKMTDVMNTAPREDYQSEDEEVTPERMRDYEKQVHDAQGQLHHCYAVHIPSGEFAGYTTVRTKDLEPESGEQWDTGVIPDHRNKGLGRWLKAANINDVVRRYPKLERVTTDNAGSNEPMLNINIEMGFKPMVSLQSWQGDLPTARERFGA